jgi:hypothetical protein
LLDSGSAEPLFEHLDHVWTFVDRVIGGTGQRVLEEVARAIRPRDELIERRDLVADHIPPSVARLVEHGRRRIETHSQALHQLDERQPAQLFRPVHSPPGVAFGHHQPSVFVVAQRRRVESEHARGVSDRHELHISI